MGIFSILIVAAVSIISIVLHEMAHGYVSYWLGDPTPKYEGRLSLNPLKHIDITGALCLIFFHVGWAKPVMINPNYYKNHKLGITLVSIAGPLMNFILFLISSLLFYAFNMLSIVNSSFFIILIADIFYYMMIINIGLCLFNLIPVPPLDGSKILGAILPDQAYNQYMKYQKYGFVFIIGIILLSEILSSLGYPSLLGTLIDVVCNFFYGLWSKIF